MRTMEATIGKKGDIEIMVKISMLRGQMLGSKAPMVVSDMQKRRVEAIGMNRVTEIDLGREICIEKIKQDNPVDTEETEMILKTEGTMKNKGRDKVTGMMIGKRSWIIKKELQMIMKLMTRGIMKLIEIEVEGNIMTSQRGGRMKSFMAEGMQIRVAMKRNGTREKVEGEVQMIVENIERMKEVMEKEIWMVTKQR